MPDKLEFLWKDRKRVCGLPLTFTRYFLSEDRLFLETGLLNLRQDEILLYRVRDIGLNITLGQRIFGVGSVKVISSDKSLPELVLKNIKQPREVKEMIHRQVEEAKAQRRMRVGELLGDDDSLDDEQI
ncbi:MAG TPA: PH domain-containing protein [Candidatus Anaerofilum faecale]|nr:PH domain-containing protein [Candidatus Anaerofilum faecale]